jgi:hypothetical protein
LAGGGTKLVLQKILEACAEVGTNLRKVKFSNMNLNDNMIVANLCKIIEGKELITHIDVSWARLSA